MKEDDHLLPQFINGRKDGMMYLTSKQPIWNNKQNAYYLDFEKRVAVPSVKNFQLVSPIYRINFIIIANFIIMQFGRVDKKTFSMDVCWPLSIFQAFGIALTSFDYR